MKSLEKPWTQLRTWARKCPMSPILQPEESITCSIMMPAGSYRGSPQAGTDDFHYDLVYPKLITISWKNECNYFVNSLSGDEFTDSSVIKMIPYICYWYMKHSWQPSAKSSVIEFYKWKPWNHVRQIFHKYASTDKKKKRKEENRNRKDGILEDQGHWLCEVLSHTVHQNGNARTDLLCPHGKRIVKWYLRCRKFILRYFSVLSISKIQ